MWIDQPWTRVKDPVEIPEEVSGESLATMTDHDLAQLLRSNLVPRQGAEARRRWDRLWQLLDDNEQLADRALDLLEQFLDACDHAERTGELDAHAATRVAKFRRFCESAWNRLDCDSGLPPDAPLGWAGRRARAFNAAARHVLDDLVTAIDAHRRAVTEPSAADLELWGTLRRVGLDPHGTRPGA